MYDYLEKTPSKFVPISGTIYSIFNRHSALTTGNDSSTKYHIIPISLSWFYWYVLLIQIQHFQFRYYNKLNDIM